MGVERLLFCALLISGLLSITHSESNISQACLPCGSTINSKDPNLPHMGFLCNEGFPDTPMEAPYNCTYTVKHTEHYTLQLFLHEMHFRENSMQIAMCGEMYKQMMELGFTLEQVCNISDWSDVVLTYYIKQESLINISIIRPEDFHLRLPSNHYGNRYGYNITYEIKPGIVDPYEVHLVDHAGRSHLSHCNYNGVPVLRPVTSNSSISNNVTKYKFGCDCLAERTHGEGCQYDDVCTKETERSVCSNHGKCKIRASMFKCECDKSSGHIGHHCEHPYTAQPADSFKCEEGTCGINSKCHVLIMNGNREERCSCNAGYEMGENNKCDPIHKYDINANISVKCMDTTDPEKYISEVEKKISRKIISAKNFKLIPMYNSNDSDHQLNREIFQVQFETNQYNLSLPKDLDSKCMNYSSNPQLSLGPIYLAENQKELYCDAYGGDEMLFTWLKDDIEIFTTRVRNCIVVDNVSLPHLGIEAEEGKWVVKPTCYMRLKIDNWNVTKEGKYTFRVTDRHHVKESHLIRNCSSNLDIVMTPLVATVHYGSDLHVNCRPNKYWNSMEQYTIEWNHPENVSSYEKETIVYHGSNATFRNITDDTEVLCIVTEPFAVRKWCPGIESNISFGNKSIQIRVLKVDDIANKHYCPGESAYNISWQDTPANKFDIQLCPKGFSGQSFRNCVVTSADKVDWMIPDFSNCKFDQLSKVFRTLTLQHALGLHGPNASFVDTNTQKLTMKILDIMKNRTEPMLPGEGSYILQLLRKIIHANHNSVDRMTPEMFYSVINLVAAHEKKFDTRELESIFKLMKDFLGTCESPEINITLSSLSAYAQYLHTNILAHNATSQRSWWVKSELKNSQLETSQTTTINTKNQNKMLYAQIVVFTEPHKIFSHRSLSYDESSDVASLLAPLVHLTIFNAVNSTTSSYKEKIRDAEAPMLTLHYPCNIDMDILKDNTSQKSWRWQCGRTNFSYHPARWDLGDSVCSPVKFRFDSTCTCSCYGQGLYGLLQVSFDSPPTPVHEVKKLLGVCLGISCGILLLCGAILLPRCCIQAVQLRVLKCLALAAFDAAFVLYAFYSIPKPKYVWVLILCIWFQILSLGIGVAQMMDIFIKLSNLRQQSDSASGKNITPMTDMLQNLPVSPTTMILIIALFMATMCSGIVYLICLVTGYQLTRPFLPVEDAPAITGAVVGFMITITVLWSYLCISNLTLMRMNYSIPHHSSAQIVRRLISLMLGDWVFIIMSLFEDFNITLNSLFCITSLALSIMIIWIYVFTADDTTCCFGKRDKNHNTGDLSVPGAGMEYVGSSVGGGENAGSCMRGLLNACQGSGSTNRSSYVGTESTSDDYRTRGDSMLSQLSASAAITECQEINPSYGGPRPNPLISRRNPKDMLPQHPHMQMYPLREEQNTNNILLRGGIDFVCGEDDTDIAKISRKRTISFTHTQPIIHEDMPKVGYLQMQPKDVKEMSIISNKHHFIDPPITFSNCPRSYVNVPASNSSQKLGKLQIDVNNEKNFLKPQKYSKKGYLPMTPKDKNNYTADQQGLNEKNTNLTCNSFTVTMNKDSESDDESLKAEIINASSPISESECEDTSKNLPYINAITPQKENRVINNGNEQLIIMHKSNALDQDYVNSPKRVTKIFINANKDDHNCSSIIATKNYVNNKSSLEMTPPRSVSPNDTLDSVNGDSSSVMSVHSSPEMIRKYNTKIQSNITSCDRSKT